MNFLHKPAIGCVIIFFSLTALISLFVIIKNPLHSPIHVFISIIDVIICYFLIKEFYYAFTEYNTSPE